MTEVKNCPMVVWGRMYGLSVTCSWPGFSLDLDNPRVRSRVVQCPAGGMFLWPMMNVCVDCFVGISYATIGL